MKKKTNVECWTTVSSGDERPSKVYATVAEIFYKLKAKKTAIKLIGNIPEHHMKELIDDACAGQGSLNDTIFLSSPNYLFRLRAWKRGYSEFEVVKVF